MTSYDILRERLEEIRAHPDCNSDFRILVEDALNRPLLTISKESELYEKLGTALDTAAREELAYAFEPFVLPIAWTFRKLGVGLEELVAVGRQQLSKAAYTFSRQRTHSFHTVALSQAELAILDELDERGIEQVAPEEIQELLRKGANEEANQILDSLSSMERWLLARQHQQISGPSDPWYEIFGAKETTDFFKEKYAIAVRKLRRPSKNES